MSNNVKVKVTCVLSHVTRKQHSPSGNPTKVLHTDHGVFVTAKDADVAYGISDLWENKPVVLTLDNDGRVIDLEEK